MQMEVNMKTEEDEDANMNMKLEFMIRTKIIAQQESAARKEKVYGTKNTGVQMEDEHIEIKNGEHNTRTLTVSNSKDVVDTSYLQAAGCNCDFKNLLSSATSEEFKNHLKNINRLSNQQIFSNNMMLELYVKLRDHVVDELLFEFVKAVVPLQSLPLMQHQTPRQFCGKAKRFRRHVTQRRKSKSRGTFQQFLKEPYSFTISEKRRSAIKEGQQRSRDLAEERERAFDVDALSFQLEEAREKLAATQRENTELTLQLREVTEERDAYKTEMDKMKKENLELYLTFST